MNKKILYSIAIGIVIVVAFAALKLNSNIDQATVNQTGAISISLTTDPAVLRSGQATLIIDVKDTEGKPVDNAKVSVDINMTSMNMGTQQGEATAQGSGKYAASARFTMLGPWRITTKVTMPNGSIENKSFTVNVQ